MEPNYESIVITNAIGLVLLFGLVVSSYMTRERRHLEDRIFFALICVCAGACIMEPATWFADGVVEPWAFAVNYIGNTYCYIGSCVCPYLWVLYMDLRLHKGSEHIRSWHPAILVPVLVLICMDIGNLFGHYMFTISDQNVYSRQPLSYLIYIVMIVLYVYSGTMKLRYQREHGPVHFFPLSMFLVPILIGAFTQAFLFGVSLAWPSMCIGLVNIHMSLQNELSYIDPLTNLCNRAYLDARLRALEREGIRFHGIMADLDYFKDINDTLGHSTGDKALVNTARLLVKASGDDATVFRFAGDEFVILLVEADAGHVEQVKRSIVEALDDFNAHSGEPYALSISLGSSAFTPGVDGIDDFLRSIDLNMYEQKHRHHREQFHERRGTL